MIHGNSNDPILVKRIGLKVWTLRDEVEAVVEKTLRAQPNKEKLSEEELAEIKKEYHYRGPVDQRPNLQLIQGGADAPDGEGEDLEAAMAAAMGGGDEEASEEPVAEESEEDLEAAMAAAMGGGEGAAVKEAPPAPTGPMKVIQRKSENIPAEKIHRGITMLSEVSMDNLYFFSSEKFLEGQSIVIEFQIPKRFVVNAQVMYCRPFNIRSRIISPNKVSQRVVAKFTFLKDGERTLLRQFIESIEPEVQAAPVVKPKEVEDDGGDDFDGLDDLGF